MALSNSVKIRQLNQYGNVLWSGWMVDWFIIWWHHTCWIESFLSISLFLLLCKQSTIIVFIGGCVQWLIYAQWVINLQGAKQSDRKRSSQTRSDRSKWPIGKKLTSVFEKVYAARQLGSMLVLVDGCISNQSVKLCVYVYVWLNVCWMPFRHNTKSSGLIIKTEFALLHYRVVGLATMVDRSDQVATAAIAWPPASAFCKQCTQNNHHHHFYRSSNTNQFGYFFLLLLLYISLLLPLHTALDSFQSHIKKKLYTTLYVVSTFFD